MLVVDLDETVVTLNTFPHFTTFALRELLRVWRPALLARLLGALVARKLLRHPHEELKRTVCDVAVALPAASIEQWARKLLARHTNSDVQRIVRDWPSTTVLTTAAPERYARVLARALGFDIVHGSRVCDGRLLHNVGEAKVSRLRGEDLVPVAMAVTDDPVLDAPLLELADRCIIVASGVLQPASGSVRLDR